MSSNVFDYGTPYDIMAGLWTELKITYSPKGEYVDSAHGFVAVYWHKTHRLMHFREVGGPDTLRTAVDQVTTLEFDLRVSGKHGEGRTRHAQIIGTETRPDIYHFHLKANGGDWYNNHYIISPNERHIMGPFVQKGKIQSIVAQTLTRGSYDVPNKYRRPVRR